MAIACAAWCSTVLGGERDYGWQRPYIVISKNATSYRDTIGARDGVLYELVPYKDTAYAYHRRTSIAKVR